MIKTNFEKMQKRVCAVVFPPKSSVRRPFIRLLDFSLVATATG